MSQALKDLSREEQEQVQPLFVSVDPERDTPKRQAESSEFAPSNITGMTGTKREGAMPNEVVAELR